jgi:hypothetical protein
MERSPGLRGLRGHTGTAQAECAPRIGTAYRLRLNRR